VKVEIIISVHGCDIFTNSQGFLNSFFQMMCTNHHHCPEFHVTTDNGLLCWQLTAQAAAHEQLQRQMLLERERFPHPHPSLVAQHEEYLR